MNISDLLDINKNRELEDKLEKHKNTIKSASNNYYIYNAVKTRKLANKVSVKGKGGIVVFKKKKKKSKQQKRLEKQAKERAKVPKKYKIYIESKYWFKRRNKYWQEHEKRCYRCDSTHHVTLHHIWYKQDEYGREPNEALAPMCWDCHELFHSIYGVKQNMSKEMVLFEQHYPYIEYTEL